MPCCTALAWHACSPAVCCRPAGLTQRYSAAPHVDPLLCGVTAVGEYLQWDICREGLPLPDLIRTWTPA
jgi:hypothetical protein